MALPRLPPNVAIGWTGSGRPVAGRRSEANISASSFAASSKKMICVSESSCTWPFLPIDLDRTRDECGRFRLRGNRWRSERHKRGNQQERKESIEVSIAWRSLFWDVGWEFLKGKW